MTNEQQKAKELAELLTAFADGKRIEYQSQQFGWCGTISLEYIVDSVINGKRPIRIKPETKRVPLTKKDILECIELGDAMWIKNINTGIVYQIVSVYILEVEVSFGRIAFDTLSVNYTFLDNTPCYKEVESE